MPAGRPTDYSPELAARICGQIGQGDSLRKVCSADEMPHISTVFLWFHKHPEFIEQYTRAKEQSADAHEDRIAEVGQALLNGEYDEKRARVALDALKWCASKLKPKKYGDRLDLGNSDDKPLEIHITR
jgi:hypothetical protein